jgi:hypothetical protein
MSVLYMDQGVRESFILRELLHENVFEKTITLICNFTFTALNNLV